MLCVGAESAYDGHTASPEVEAKQLAILRSEAPSADKAIACKLLAIDGSYAAVPDLARLLRDPQLASWARIALEAIPGPEADEALRQATGDVQGLLLVGVINSIGVRRDAAAVEVLSAKLLDSDREVARAAAVALGHIGNDEATAALRKALTIEPAAVRSAVAQGCILCAEAQLAAGHAPEAAAIYDQVRGADVPLQRLLEATRGAILARGDEGLPLLVEQLRSDDKHRFQLGLMTAREFPGAAVDPLLAKELMQATPLRAALIVEAMADRPQTVALPALAQAAAKGPKPVRVAALTALGRAGDASCLAALLAAAAESDAEISQAARAAAASLPDAKVDAQIVSQLASADGRQLPMLIEIVGRRRIAAVPELRKALDSPDAAVRAAALAALGETVGPSDLKLLVAQLVALKHREDSSAAQAALHAAAVRMPDREACAAELAGAVDQSTDARTKASLLQILGAVGGAKALTAVGAAAKSSDAQLQDVSSRVLGEWMTDDAAPLLLELSQSGPEKIRGRALRGFMRIARQFDLPEERRVEMCKQALAAARQPAERKLVLDSLKRYSTPSALQLAIGAMQDEETRDDATAATLVIAQRLAEQGVDVSGALSEAGIAKVKLEIVKAEYGADGAWKNVTDVLQQRAGDLPLVALPGSYNKTFGGDPAPNTPKTLKIDYRIDGKPGQAQFDENATIVLPIPK